MNEMERDPRVDAAWRAANRDEPPAALDDAIRAAARRAVEAGPQGRRDKHWWYPFAAAATVAVIAVGLLQLTPPERVSPISNAPKLVQEEAASPPPASAPASAPPLPARESSDQHSISSHPPNSSSRASNAISPGATPPTVVKKEVPVEKRGQLAGAMQNERKPQRQLEATEKFARTPEETPRNVAAPAPAPSELTPRSEPFPAAKPEAFARRDEAVSPEVETRARAAAPTAPPFAAAAPRQNVAASRALEQKQSQPESALAKDALEAQPKSKTAPRSAEDWIKLIRQLKSEGRVEEATKEIAAFRSAYGERADAMLPADLRQVTPSSPATTK